MINSEELATKKSFDVRDVETYKHGLNPQEKRKWVAVASAVLRNSNDPAVAVNIANKKVGKQRRKG